MMTKLDIHLPTGTELINMLMRIQVNEFNAKTAAAISVPTMLEQAQNVIDEDNYFVFRGNNG